MKKYDKKPLSYIIFKISSKWENIIRRNFAEIGLSFSGLQEIVGLIIVGLTSLVFAFIQLATDYYVIVVIIRTEPYRSLMSATQWELIFAGISLAIFVPMILYIIRYTKREYPSVTEGATQSDGQPSPRP
jgi:hypothetical protein